MARSKATPRADLNDAAAKKILAVLIAEFRNNGRGSDDLRNTYEGPAPGAVESACLEDGQISEVDFDLALKDLVRARLVKTGPMEMYDNDPNSGVFIAVMYSKNEYTHLTEAGYRAAAQMRPAPTPRTPMPNVHISGGTFHNSPVGVGGQVQQTVHITAASDDLLAQLRDQVISKIQDEAKKANALARLDELEAAPDKPTKLDRYNHFVGVIADHMTVFGPLLSPLLQQIMS